MKKKVKIGDLKNHLSEHLRYVERGNEIIVTDRNRPMARIVPYGDAEPRITIRPARRPFSEIRDKVYPPANWPIDSLTLLLEDRGKR